MKFASLALAAFLLPACLPEVRRYDEGPPTYRVIATPEIVADEGDGLALGENGESLDRPTVERPMDVLPSPSCSGGCTTTTDCEAAFGALPPCKGWSCGEIYEEGPLLCGVTAATGSVCPGGMCFFGECVPD